MRRGWAMAMTVVMGVAVVMMAMEIGWNHADTLYYNITSAKAFKALGLTDRRGRCGGQERKWDSPCGSIADQRGLLGGL
jgi:hypothetical protein